MRKLYFLLLSFLLVFFLASCFAPLKFVKPDVTKLKKVALVTIYAPKALNMSAAGSSIVEGIIETAARDVLALKPELTQIKDAFYTDFDKLFPFKLIPEDDLFAMEEYQQIESSSLITDITMSIPDGYKGLLYTKGSAKYAFSKMPKIDGVLLAYGNYSVIKSNIPFKYYVQAEIQFSVYNRALAKLGTARINAKSDDTMAVVIGFKPASAQQLMKQATKNLIKQIKHTVEMEKNAK